MTFIIGLIVWVICAGLCEEVARSKGHSGPFWLFVGLVGGPLALLAAVGLGDKRLADALAGLAAQPSSEDAQSGDSDLGESPITHRQYVAIIVGAAILFIVIVVLSVRHNDAKEVPHEVAYVDPPVLFGLQPGCSLAEATAIITEHFGVVPFHGDTLDEINVYHEHLIIKHDFCGYPAEYLWEFEKKKLIMLRIHVLAFPRDVAECVSEFLDWKGASAVIGGGVFDEHVWYTGGLDHTDAFWGATYLQNTSHLFVFWNHRYRDQEVMDRLDKRWGRKKLQN